MRITSKGQVTIPKDIREKAGLLPGIAVTFEYDGKVVRLKQAEDQGADRGRRLVEHLRKYRHKVTMSTDEIMALTRGED